MKATNQNKNHANLIANLTANHANLTQSGKIRHAFTMVELVFVIVIIGVLATVSIWFLPRTELKQAAETMINNLKYTKTLAQLDERQFLMRDDMYLDEVRKLSEDEKNKVMQGQMEKWQMGMWQFQFHATSDLTGQNPDSKRSDQTYTIYSELASNNTTKPFDGIPNNGDIIAQDPITKECISGYNSDNLKDCEQNYGFAREARFFDTYQTQVVNIFNEECRAGSNAYWKKGNTFAIYFDGKGNPYCKVGNEGTITAIKSPITIELKRKNENAFICITKGGIIEGGNLVDKNGNPQQISKDDPRMRGIPVKDGKCQDI